jgi:hypothetical protein
MALKLAFNAQHAFQLVAVVKTGIYEPLTSPLYSEECKGLVYSMLEKVFFL